MRLTEAYSKYKWGIWIILIFAFNYLIRDTPASFDLTEDKRYTLTTATKNLLSDQENRILVEVLYKGDFPAGYKRLQLAVQDILRKMQSYNSNLTVRFEDPTKGEEEEVNRRMELFAKMGLIPITINYPGSKEFRATQAFPYAVFSEGQKTVVVPLLEETNIGGYNEEKLNDAVAALEYKFANAIQKIGQNQRRKIGIIQKKGSFTRAETIGLQKELSKFYQVGRFSFDSVELINPEIEIIVVPTGVEAYSEKELLAIDQYVMGGGNVIWLLDALYAHIDSVRIRGEYAPYQRDSGLENLLFKYGIRINSNMVVDLNSGTIPLATGIVGGKPQYDFFPWYYHIIPQANQVHPVTKNLMDVKLYFPSSIDTVRAVGNVAKTVLLSSSAKSKIQSLPRSVSFEITKYPPESAYFDDSNIPLAVLLEGEFTSFFNNRLTSEWQKILMNYGQTFQNKSKSSIQLVVSDSDFIKTRYAGSNSIEVPVGYDYFEKKEYTGNLNLILNTIEYMMGNGNILSSKSKRIKLRLLDTIKAESEKNKWQAINLVFPLLMLVLLGLLFNFFRRRRYGQS